MHEHVTSVCRAAYYHPNNNHCLKAFLTQKTLVTVVHAFVTSRIDYCNSLLYGISDYNTNRLQRIQNSTAPIVTNTKTYDHIPQFFKNYIGYLLDSVSISRFC
jgi:glycogen synthase